jgi:very-short-patch-repair endonuclease
MRARPLPPPLRGRAFDVGAADRHRTDAEQWGRDLRRHREMERLGWAVVRWTKSDVDTHASGAVAQLRSLLARRG